MVIMRMTGWAHPSQMYRHLDNRWMHPGLREEPIISHSRIMGTTITVCEWGWFARSIVVWLFCFIPILSMNNDAFMMRSMYGTFVFFPFHMMMTPDGRADGWAQLHVLNYTPCVKCDWRDVPGQDFTRGRQLQIYSCNDTPAQWFNIVPTFSSTRAQIRCVRMKMCRYNNPASIVIIYALLNEWVSQNIDEVLACDKGK